ncbi:uncharacterized protein WM277_011697 [Molossus nigricans]
MRAIAATALLVKEAQKLTIGQDLQIIGGHTTEALLRSPPDRWISNARLTQYQVLLLNPPQVTFSKSSALNPATLLPDGNQGELLHDCHSLLDSIEGTRPDLKDEQIANSDYDLYTDGSSFIKDGTRYAGAAAVTNLQSLQAIEVIRREARLSAKERKQPTEAEPPPLDIEPGDWIWIKKFNKETLEPTWDGPHLVILTTPTAFKVSNKRPWIHHTQEPLPTVPEPASSP